MDPNKVFISAPLDLKWSTVTRFAQKLLDNNVQAFAWDRNSIYDQSIFDECGSVIFILPGYTFGAAKDDLPWGQKRELFRAHSQSKKIYIGYSEIYEANINGEDFIKGISGTSNSIFANIEKEIKSAIRMRKSEMNIVMNSIYGAHGIDCELDHIGNGMNFNQIDKQIHGSTTPVSERYSKGAIGVNGKPGVMGEDGYDYDVRLLLML